MLLVDLPGIAIFVGDSRVRKAEQVSPVPSPARPLHGLGRGVVLRRGATPRTMESSASPASSTPLSPLVLTANNVPRYCPMSLGGQSHLQLRAPVLEAQRISAKIKSPSEQQADPPPSDVRAFTRTRRRVRGPTVLTTQIRCVTETSCSAGSVLCPVLHLFISRGILFIFLFPGSLLESLINKTDVVVLCSASGASGRQTPRAGPRGPPSRWLC